jgi:hypothetical protein
MHNHFRLQWWPDYPCSCSLSRARSSWATELQVDPIHRSLSGTPCCRLGFYAPAISILYFIWVYAPATFIWVMHPLLCLGLRTHPFSAGTMYPHLLSGLCTLICHWDYAPSFSIVTMHPHLPSGLCTLILFGLLSLFTWFTYPVFLPSLRTRYLAIG